MVFPFHDRKRLLWLLLALASMLSSAYCFFGWMNAVGQISGWRYLPKYEAQIPRLEREAKVWSALSITLPFVAALLLGFGRRASSVQPPTDPARSLTYPTESVTEKWFAPVMRYFRQLVISFLGTLGFVAGLFVLGLLLQKRSEEHTSELQSHH